MKTETGHDIDHRRLLRVWIGAEPFTLAEADLRARLVGCMGSVAGYHVFRRLCAVNREAKRIAETIGPATALEFLQRQQEPWMDLFVDCLGDAPPPIRMVIKPDGSSEMQELQTRVKEVWVPL